MRKGRWDRLGAKESKERGGFRSRERDISYLIYLFYLFLKLVMRCHILQELGLLPHTIHMVMRVHSKLKSNILLKIINNRNV